MSRDGSRILFGLAVVALVVAQTTKVDAQPAAPTPLFDAPGGISSSQILVRCTAGTDPRTQPSRSLISLNNRWGATHCRPAYQYEFANPELAAELGLDRTFVVEVRPGTNTAMMAREYAESRSVTHAAPVLIGETAEVIPNDPSFSFQWNMHNVWPPPIATDADVDGPGAWGISTGEGGETPVTVAIVDTGVSPHNEFVDRMVPGINTHDPLQPDLTIDSCFHGTHVAGIVAAKGNNNLGIAGMSWGAQIMPVRVFAGCSGTELNTANGIIWAADNGADILNISLQFYAPDSSPAGIALLEAAVNYAHGQGALVVTAAGNERGAIVAYPAAFDNALAVSATNNRDRLAVFSNYGPEVDIAAPGDDIYSTWVFQGYALLDGTSMASPHVAGLAALLKSYDPTLTNDELRSIILATADDLGPCGKDNKFGTGRMNAHRAVRFIAGSAPAGIIASAPETCAIDARQPSEINGVSPNGWDVLQLSFEGDVDSLSRSDFIIHEVGDDGFPPAIVDVVALDESTVEVHLSRSISPGAWTTVSHEPSGSHTRVGYLPGDVNGDAIANARDIIAIIDGLNGVGLPLPDWSLDVNRSGANTAADIIRLIDLLNGAGVYQPYLNVSLP